MASAVEEIKQRLDIVETVGQYVALKKAGRNFKGLCPFHREKTPSFIVSPESQRWHCFGACNAGGDLFTFIMKAENLEFAEALRLLARKAGFDLAPRGEKQTQEERERRKLERINDATSLFFHHQLLHSAEGEAAKNYVRQRGLEMETVNAFQLGYAPDSWDALSEYLLSKGYSLADLQAAGLVIEREDGSHYDRFRGRLIFPIRDPGGRVVGFGGRALDDSQPKYLNSSQTPLFDKGNVLYGIDLARQAIRETGTAIIVEGYMDVLMAHQNRFRNVVASMGTALTEGQLRILKRFAKRFSLALDADIAGSQATRRGMEVAQEAFSERVMPLPTRQGLLSYVGDSEIDLRVIPLPLGKDPDEMIKESPERWEELTEGAKPIMEWLFDSALTERDLNSPQSKAEVVRELLPVIEGLGEGIQRTHYLQELARLVKVDERTLWESRTRSFRGRRQARREKEGETEGQTLGLEEYCLALLAKKPEFLEAALDLNLCPEDFTRADDRELLTALKTYTTKKDAYDTEGFRKSLDVSLWERFTALEEQLTHQPPTSLDYAEKAILRLQERSRRQKLTELRFLLEEAKAQGETEDIYRFGQMVANLTKETDLIQKKLHSRTFAGKFEKRRSPKRP